MVMSPRSGVIKADANMGLSFANCVTWDTSSIFLDYSDFYIHKMEIIAPLGLF